ncbi:tRNA (adenosine(37)-N6)-threonylcarbamoyltransferase complex dimerization subunit type 1 TsaB [Granulicella sp. WH15]|uniref:tRNA (adenosine(37)-N6)-threonylcarbamoyltransferase complex dimerization subunit type 1 TsaB n=1 Tax=Granulicella sp. WH15 TaxID=2602070 RepID=UPI0013A54FCD|nr:tRNA (adenosine(37)-N6)-threonylcarbamoyltransferase complex dimerization subunit type 1 TsaB [Granulicella sp. WH15]
MRLLLLNTCGAEGSAALADTALPQPVVAAETLPGRGSSEQLLPVLHRLFKVAGWPVSELGAVAVVHGPGSFTGVRVGLSAAKGLCAATGGRMIAISRLALVAASVEADGETLALLDAGRGEFYAGFYRGRECLSEQLLRREEVLELLASRTPVTCEARVRELLPEVDGLRLVEEPGAVLILRLAVERIAAEEWTDVVTIDANYLRRTDAELLVERRAAAESA